MRITDVDPTFIIEDNTQLSELNGQPGWPGDDRAEADQADKDYNNKNPQFRQLNDLLSRAREPWERNQIKWRIENLRSAEAMAGEPGGGNGAPLNSQGNYIPVLPTKEWMAKNPSIVKTLPNNCLPPSMQKPGVMDKIKSAIGLEEGADQDLGNGFTLTTTNYDGQNYPTVLDTQGKIYWLERTDNIHTIGFGSHIKIENGKATSGIPGKQTLAAMKAAGWNVREPSQREPETAPAPAGPFVPKDYQTGEPLTKGQDGKWYNKAGQERDNLHGGPIMSGGTAQFRSLKESVELNRIKSLTSKVLKG
jgi:hypothetical protein